jgi:hypothetical protein
MSSKSWSQFTTEISLGENQKRLCRQLIDFHETVGKELRGIYLGSIMTISHTSNPDRFAQAAHSCRELMSVFKIKIFGGKGYSINKKDVESILKGNDPLKNVPNETIKLFQDSWPKLYDYFSKVAHHNKSPMHYEFSRKFEELESIFRILTKTTIELFKEIDIILKKGPTKKNVKEAIKRLKNAILAQYFYNNVGINWLNSLEKEGVFENPPIVEDNTQHITQWPQSKFLLKSANRKPNKVMNIIKKCKFPNDPQKLNIYFLIDFVEIALIIPSNIAKQIIELKEKQQWLRHLSFNYLLADKLSDLMVKLVNGNEIDSSLKLLDILLDVTIEKRDKEYTQIVEAKPYIDIRIYKNILEKKIINLLKKKPFETMKHLADKLNKAIHLEIKANNRQTGKDDYSYIWKPAIEDSFQSFGNEDFKCLLVISLKNTLENIGKSNIDLLRKAIEFLDKYNYSIFIRIKLHIYRLFPEVFKKEIQEVIKQYFDDIDNIRVEHEYKLLFSQQFCSLPKSLKEQYLSSIENISKKKKNGKDSELYQLRHLLLIEDCIDKRWKDKFEYLNGKYMKTKNSNILSHSGSPINARSIEELEKLYKNKKIEGIINYFKECKQEKHIFGEPYAENPGKNLERLTKKYSEEFSKNALLFWKDSVKATYIYHLLNGLQEAIKEKKKINWRETINLIGKFILKGKHLKLEKEEELGSDLDSVLMVSIRLLNEGLSCFSIPFKERKNVWEIIRKLSNNTEPTLEYENEYGGDNMDPATLSMNTIRGKAIHGVINYALWCNKNLNERILVKEAKEILEEHLDINKEPTLTIRAIYGWRLPNLIYLDKKWVKQNIDKIFPKNKESEKLWLAAFETYLANPVYKDIFKLIEIEYEKAISYIAVKEYRRKLFVNIHEKLAQHLIVAYVFGISNKELMDKFFSKAPISARATAINFIGREIFNDRNLKENKDKIDLRKIKLILNERLKEKNIEELKEFGWWFINSPFDKSWNIEKLYEIFKVTKGEIEGVVEIIEKLKEYVNVDALHVSECLFLILEGENNYWDVYYKKETYKEIILTLFQSKNVRVRKTLEEIINRLVEKGFLEFRGLL